MAYVVVHKQPLVIIDEMTIPVPMSHPIENKSEAMRWMVQRGMQGECKVMPVCYFKALGGWIN